MKLAKDKVSFTIRLAVLLAKGGAEHLNPEPLNPEPLNLLTLNL